MVKIRNPNSEIRSKQIGSTKYETKEKRKMRNGIYSQIKNRCKITLVAEERPSKRYDLEERTALFAASVRAFVKALERNIWNQEDIKQVVRSSGSVGANYIEANESLSKKDFVLRIKICRKEAKESRYWLRLLDVATTGKENQNNLIQEATELMNIFGAILRKSEC